MTPPTTTQATTPTLPLPLREGDRGRGPTTPHSLTPPTPAPLRNNNPRGNPNLAPRCGAKARTTGCPCRAPAMPNGRCRMHGGASRGPTTPEGLARMTQANTKHGNFAAPQRHHRRYIRTLIARTNLLCAARRVWPYLPENMSDRLAAGPEELATPIHPSNLPYLTRQQLKLYRLTTLLAPPSSRHAPSPTARAAEHQAVQAEAATQAPWREAITAARTARRAHRAAQRAAKAARAAARQARAANRQNPPTERNPIHRENPAPTPGQHGIPQNRPAQRNPIHRENIGPTPGAPPDAAAPAPYATTCDLTDLERELAARKAGLRTPVYPQPHPEPPPVPPADSAPTGQNPLHREQPPTSSATAQTKPQQGNPIQRERRPTALRLTPTKAIALRTTTQSQTWQDSPLHAELVNRFGHPLRAWRIPQAMPAAAPVTPPVRRFTTEHQ